MSGFIKVVYRPSASSEGVPFGLRSVGHARLAHGDSTEPLLLDFVQFLWIESGDGLALVDGARHALGPGYAACYRQGARHRLMNPNSKTWECRWITLDGPAAAPLTSGFGYGAKPFNAGPCPVADFERLELAIRNVGAKGARAASLPAYELLLKAAPDKMPVAEDATGPSGDRAFWEKAMQTVAASISKNEMGVSQIAEQFGLGRTHFAMKFKAETGSSPKDYIMMARLQKALSLLKETDMPISEVSKCCGFANANYFAKFFRARMGVPPSGFRTSNGRI
jgi:AraC-like DNA-binding protein